MKRTILCCAALLACMMVGAPPSVTLSSSTTVTGTIPLTICQVAASDITGDGAVISWHTNGPSTSQVFYDTVRHDDLTDYASQVESDDLVSIHSLALVGLASGTTYYYAVKSDLPENGTSLTAVQAGLVFTTPTEGTVLTIASPPNGKLPGGKVGVSYSYTLVARGGTPGYTWCIVAGCLPCGLSLNASTGVIHGTPTKVGTFKFTIRVTDTVGASASTALRINITAGCDIANASLPDEEEGVWQALVRAASIPATILDSALSSVIG